MRFLPFTLFAFVLWSPRALAVDTTSPTKPVSSGQAAIKRMEVAPGLKVTLFADETMVSHPVAFCTDEQGRFFVAESYRYIDPSGAWTDIRRHMDWLDEDLASRSLEDRRRLYVSRLGPALPDWTRFSERVRLLEDRDHDGKADHSTVFAEGFNDLLDGTAAGIFARKGNVWFTCIPNLWLLRDTQGTGKADFRQSLHRGFGVRLGYLGHDLHGLCLGPDGKLYFSIGDRGTHIDEGAGRVVDLPETGAVFRCDQDGTNLEVFATGLRNPQELAFDKFGNLWTCDNNADQGDEARWVYLVEGGDSGWRVGFQHLTYPVLLGAWNAEKMWHPSWKGQSAALVPPVANVSQGPSGVAYYPGTGLGTNFDNHFLVCDFKNEAGGILTLSARPKGASFELTDQAHFLWRIPASDVEFGTDGSVYACTWNGNIGTNSSGNIYKITDPVAVTNSLVAETRRLIGEGMSKRSKEELATLLNHADLRVRREAQFELADRGMNSVPVFDRVLENQTKTLPRLHAVWGLGQIAAKRPGDTRRLMKPVIATLKDSDAEVQAQSAKVLGEIRCAEAFKPLVTLLNESTAPRVKFFATQSLGKLARKDALEPLVAVLRQNHDEDPMLRHAAVYAWASLKDPESAKRCARDESASVRLGAALVMRRLNMPEIAGFLDDTDPLVVAEAARAINDLPMTESLPWLASLADSKTVPTNEATVEPLWRRVVNANFRVGEAGNAERLARLALRVNLPVSVREEALRSLGDWSRPSNRDALTGLWRPLKERDAATAREPARTAFAGLARDPNASVRLAAIRLAGKFELSDSAPVLTKLVSDPAGDGPTRVEALRALASVKDTGLLGLTEVLGRDSDEAVRKEAQTIRSRLQPGDAAERWRSVLETGTPGERQNAFAELAKLDSAGAGGILKEWMERLLAGKVPPELHLDLLGAAATQNASKELVKRYDESRPKNDALAPYRAALAGGNAAAGRKVFMERVEAACIRCHKIGDEGGDVGPNLKGVGTRLTREQILESIVFPNKQIAAGFESVLVTLKNGTSYGGVLKNETASALTLNSPEDGLATVAKKDIADRQRSGSGMVEGLAEVLGKRDLRNLVEFLANLK